MSFSELSFSLQPPSGTEPYEWWDKAKNLNDFTHDFDHLRQRIEAFVPENAPFEYIVEQESAPNYRIEGMLGANGELRIEATTSQESPSRRLSISDGRRFAYTTSESIHAALIDNEEVEEDPPYRNWLNEMIPNRAPSFLANIPADRPIVSWVDEFLYDAMKGGDPEFHSEPLEDGKAAIKGSYQVKIGMLLPDVYEGTGGNLIPNKRTRTLIVEEATGRPLEYHETTDERIAAGIAPDVHRFVKFQEVENVNPSLFDVEAVTADKRVQTLCLTMSVTFA